MSQAILFDNVKKSFGEQAVLKGVSLTVAAGETVGLVGINGAGKTTLIRALLDLNRPDAGRITIFGEDHLRPRSRRHLTYLAERFVPPPFATGHEVLHHLCELHGVHYDRERAAREAVALDLDPLALDRHARDYSKGMGQKLGLIACLLPRPKILVLDEPMSGLDPRARSAFKSRLGALAADGITLFFSTHLLIDIDALCDRIAVLNKGLLHFDGTPEMLLEDTGAEDLEAAYLASIS
ncbi:MAG: ABC transporter ATP-binding protein [Pseudomonadota bacterium]